MLWRNLAADKKCPQLKIQTTTLGSLPYSLREVCAFFEVPRQRDRETGPTV